VINKADRDGGGKLYQELMGMLNVYKLDRYPGGWRPPIIMAGNTNNQDSFRTSLEELTDTIEAHYQNLVSKDLLSERLLRNVMIELEETLEAAILEPIVTKLMKSGKMDRMIDKMFRRESDPNTLAEEIVREYLKGHH